MSNSSSSEVKPRTGLNLEKPVMQSIWQDTKLRTKEWKDYKEAVVDTLTEQNMRRGEFSFKFNGSHGKRYVLSVLERKGNGSQVKKDDGKEDSFGFHWQVSVLEVGAESGISVNFNFLNHLTAQEMILQFRTRLLEWIQGLFFGR